MNNDFLPLPGPIVDNEAGPALEVDYLPLPTINWVENAKRFKTKVDYNPHSAHPTMEVEAAQLALTQVSLGLTEEKQPAAPVGDGRGAEEQHDPPFPTTGHGLDWGSSTSDEDEAYARRRQGRVLTGNSELTYPML